MEQPSLEQVRRATEGDASAIEQIVRMYYGPILQYLHRFVGDLSDAEDLAQEVFLRMARNLSGFDGRCRFSTWLFQIAKNAGIDCLRRRETERQNRYSGEQGIVLADQRDVIAEVEDAQVLWQSIGCLNDDLRAALLLRDLMGFQYQEIAEILGCTLATVKWRIYEARARVQRRYIELSRATAADAEGGSGDLGA
ncbi:MAG: sigma-70 family RNA polymerase sigma factor [Thermoleophilia bacterium]